MQSRAETGPESWDIVFICNNGPWGLVDLSVSYKDLFGKYVHLPPAHPLQPNTVKSFYQTECHGFLNL